MNPFYTIVDQNPNEIHGVRACSIAGHQKSPDCGGRWVVSRAVRVVNPNAPLLAMCEHHLREVVAELDSTSEVAKLGYRGVPQTAPAAKTHAKRSPRKRDEVPSL